MWKGSSICFVIILSNLLNLGLRGKVDLGMAAVLKPSEVEHDYGFLGNEPGSGSGDDDDDDDDGTDSATEVKNKFVEGSGTGLVLEHVDFVLLRLKHIMMATNSNITELTALQQKEFAQNPIYKQGWYAAVRTFKSSKNRARIFGARETNDTMFARNVPEAYHLAIIAYTLNDPAMYRSFNKATREICSGTDLFGYHWKSYFKLLHLAVETLGSGTIRWTDNRRFLYRGATQNYDLVEGQVLAFQHFISASAQLTVAEQFAEGKTVFEFQGLYNGTAMVIWDHSVFEGEMEVLFSPLQIFEVDSVHVGRYHTRYVLIKHQLPTLPCDDKTAQEEDIKEEDEAIQEDISVTTKWDDSTIFPEEKSTIISTTAGGSTTWTPKKFSSTLLVVGLTLVILTI